jgi:hypothetical protein
MKKSTTTWLASTLAALCLAPASAYATSDKDCDRPLPPKVPNGRTASNVDMIGATQRFKLYVESAETFLACLQQAEDTLTETGRDVKLKRIERKREEVTKEREDTVAKFNEQVRIYNERTGESPAGQATPGSAPTPEAGSSPAAPPAPAGPDPKSR